MEAGSSSSVGEKLKFVMDVLLTRLEKGETVESPTVKFLLGEKERLEHMEAELEDEKKRKEKELEEEKKMKEKELEEEKKRKEEVVDETLRSIRALFSEEKTDTDPVVKSLLEEKDRLLEEKKDLDRQLVLLWGSRLGVGAAATSFAGTDTPVPQPVPVEGISNLQQLITAENPRGRPKGFSSVGSEEADGMLRELDFDEVNGNALFPIKVPLDAPQCAVFNFSAYPSENAGTPHLLKHHQEELTKFGVRFGPGGFHVYNLQKQKAFSLLTSTGQSYKGTVDGAIAPFGLGLAGATRQLRICYEHKQTEWQKAEYRRQHPDEYQEEEKLSASATRSFQFAGGDKGQAVTELLAAYAVNCFPLLLDLTDGNVHHLLHLTDCALVFWENLTPTAAYYKQAEVLTSGLKASSPHLRLKDIPEEEGAPLKKMRKWRPENGLLAQLSCLEDLPADTRVQTALELFHSWSHITPPPLPMPEAVAHFYT